MKSRDGILYLIYKDREQILENCFIRQLYATLCENFQVIGVSEADLRSGDYRQPGDNTLVLSVLPLRCWRNLIPFMARYAEKAQLFLYDQDPWEAYHDKGCCRGVYPLAAELLSAKAFLVTSKWWADYIAQHDGLPTRFVRMGALAANCDVGPPFSERPYPVGFQGAVHPHRQAFFDRMAARGIEATLLERLPFTRFLKTVQQIGIFLYDDNNAITVDGRPTSFHGLWGKCLTVAARGCFVIRNDDESREPYGINELPTVFPYRDEAEVPELVARIRDMTESERVSRVADTVDRIKQRNDWKTVVDQIYA